VKARKIISSFLIIMFMCTVVLLGVNIKEAEAIAVGTWIHGGDDRNHIETVSVFPNGNILLAGYYDGEYRDYGRAQIIDNNYNNVNSWQISSRQFYTSTTLSDGNVLIAGERYWEIRNSTGELQRSGSCSWHRGIAYTSAQLQNGNIILAGDNGYWQIISPTGSNLMEKQWLHGTDRIKCSCVLPNGNILLAGHSGNWEIITPTGSSISSGQKNFSIWDCTVLSDGNVLLAGDNYWEITDSSGNRICSGSLASHVHIYTCLQLSNGNILLAGGYSTLAQWDDDYFAVLTNTGSVIYSMIKLRPDGVYTSAALSGNRIMLAGKRGHWHVIPEMDYINNLNITRFENRIDINFSHNPSNILFEGRIKRDDSSVWTTKSFCGCQYSFSNLTPDTPYEIQIRQKITVDTDIWYPSTPRLIYTRPAIPIQIQFPTVGENMVKIRWNTNGNPTGAEGTRYFIQRKKDGETSWTTVAANITSSDTVIEYEDSGLSSDAKYFYRVGIYGKDGTHYYTSGEHCVTTAVNPAVAAAEAARSMAQAASEAAAEARDKAWEVYDLVNNLDIGNRFNSIENRLINIEQGQAYPPTIKSVKGLNNATATRTSTIQVIINATGATEYRASIVQGSGEWQTDNVITVTDLKPGANTIYVEIKNDEGLTDRDTITIFRI